MIKAVVIFLLSLFSLNAFSLDISIDIPLDPYYCDSNPPECQPLPSIVPKFDFHPYTTKEQWITFATYQLLDIYTTSRALEYDCIKEVNPLFTDTPSDTRLFLTKSAILYPILINNNGWQDMTYSELHTTNVLYTFVIVNNYMLLNDAKQDCIKVR